MKIKSKITNSMGNRKDFPKRLLPFIMFFLMGTALVAQEKNITGTVTTSSDNLALPGVTVAIKGTSTGTITDSNGNYSIMVQNDAQTLVFSFIGFETQEFQVTGQSVINVALNEDVQDLEEVVVVGYGAQKKVNLSGAVDYIDAKEIESRPVANIAQGLQGVAPNLNIDFYSGEPGATPNINIRGFTSINGGEPLIILDGVPVDASELSRIAPEDVASYSVLKDASSAAIYGARAAFGVVLINTKVGSGKKMQISYSNNFAWEKPTVLPDKITDPYIYLRLRETSTDNTPWDNQNYSDETYAWAKEVSDGDVEAGVRLNPADESLYEYMGNRDWTYYFMDDYTFSQNNHLSLSGSGDNVTYYLSGGYNSQNGALKIADDYYDRYTFKSRVNYKPVNWLTVGNNTIFGLTNRIEPSYLSVWDLYNFHPTDWDKNPDGSWASTDVGRMAAKLTEGGEVSNKYNNFQSTFSGSVDIIENVLSLQSNFTIRKGTRNYGYNYSKYKIGYGPTDIREEGSNFAYRSATFDTYNLFDIYTAFNKTINKHDFSATLGYSQEFERMEWFSASKDKVISASLPTISLATGEDDVEEEIAEWAVQSAFYRLNYTFNNKYIVEFNGRYDGSSKFPEDKRFGFFPSASAAWRVDQENFMNAVPAISNLKVRTSYGSLGNQLVTEYGYIPSMSSVNSGYIIGDSEPLEISSPGLVSPNYTWEEVSTINAGIDLGLFNNKIYTTFDVYTRQTMGMLTLGKDLPDVLGASEPSENAADLETKGWELSIDYKENFNVVGKKLYVNTRFILSDSKSTITDFDNPNKNLSQYYVGKEIGEIWGFESDGLFQTQEEIDALDQTQIIPWGALAIVPGWPKYVDQDGNGIIEKGTTVDDPKDLKVIGNSSARYRFAFDLNLSWNGFDMRAFFQGVAKRDYYPQHYLYWGFYQQPYAGGYQHLTDFYRATDDSDVQMAQHSQSYIDAGLAYANTDAKYPVLQSWLADYRENLGLAVPQTRYMLDGSYLRLKNLTFGYTFPSDLTNKLNINKFRVFISGENIAEWSELSDFFDPEAVNDNGYGYAYPFQRRYAVGLNITF